MAIKYVNPLYWFVLKPVDIILWLLTQLWWLPTTIFNAIAWAWNWYPNLFYAFGVPKWMVRLPTVSLAIFTAIPGTWTYVFYVSILSLARKYGYETEAKAVMDFVGDCWDVLTEAAGSVWSMLF